MTAGLNCEILVAINPSRCIFISASYVDPDSFQDEYDWSQDVEVSEELCKADLYQC